MIVASTHAITVREAIRTGTVTLEESEEMAPHARADALLLLRHTLGISPAALHAHGERLLTPKEAERFRARIEDRLRGKPIQYMTGQQEFFGLTFQVSPDVLIPRPETEHLVEAAIACLKGHPSPQIADVGTGSGAIAVALAHALPQARVIALDISPKALTVAARNAERNGVAARIRFVESDVLSAVQGERFDAILSNPPYIALEERNSLPREVREYEPTMALFAGPTGLEFYQRLIPAARPLLVPGGWLLMEIGHGQRSAIQGMLTGWRGLEWIADLQGIPRVAVARKPGSLASETGVANESALRQIE